MIHATRSLQSPSAVPFPVEHDGLLARHHGRRLELADPPLHARPDRGKIFVQDSVDRSYLLLQAPPTSKAPPLDRQAYSSVPPGGRLTFSQEKHATRAIATEPLSSPTRNTHHIVRTAIRGLE